MSTTQEATRALQIQCAKPDCHWRGSPKDAPTHPCPTPAPEATDEEKAAAAAERGAKLPQTESSFLSDTDKAEIAERDALFAKLDDVGATFDRKTSTEGLRELVALTTGEEPAVDYAPVYDSDPTTKDELEAWLAAHGKYDARGVPTDERTATLDARYAAFLEADREPDLDAELDPEPDPAEPAPAPAAPAEEEQDEPERIAAETGFAETPSGAGPLPPADEHVGEEMVANARPWQTVIAAALEQQTGVKDFKWLVVWHPSNGAEAELIGRGKVKNEATVIQEDVRSRGELPGEIAVVKTADVLKQAAEIEKRRELVDEPDKTVEPDADPEQPETPGNDPEQPEQPEATPTPEGGKPALFDASDYDREDLALPKVDGHSIDRIAVQFSGEVMLDRSSPDHVALFRRLKLGRRVELWVEAKGLGVTGKGATNKDGELDVVVSKRSVVIQTVRILGAEDLGNAAAEIAAQARDAMEQEDARKRIPAE